MTARPKPASGVQPPDLGDPAARDRLSGPSFRAFLATARYLDLSVAERCRLLGDLAPATYHRWATNGAPHLSRDLLERISLVLGIVKALMLLFASDDAGKRWLRAANTDAPFGGQGPLAHMLRGSIADLFAVRRYVDSWRGVWP